MRHQIGDQAFVAGNIFAQYDHGLLDGRMAVQDALDLFEFDAIATQFDLLIDAAQELQAAIGQEAHAVAGAVETSARLRAKRMWDEAFGGLLGPIEIAARQARACQEKFTSRAVRDGLQVSVEHIELRIGDGRV